MLISELQYGQKFKLKSLEGVFIRDMPHLKKDRSKNSVVYHKEGLEDLSYMADMEVKILIN